MILYDHKGNKIEERCIIHCTSCVNDDYMVTTIKHTFIHNRHESSTVIAYSITKPNQHKFLLYTQEKGLRDQLNIWEVVSDEMRHSEK